MTHWSTHRVNDDFPKLPFYIAAVVIALLVLWLCGCAPSGPTVAAEILHAQTVRDREYLAQSTPTATVQPCPRGSHE